MANAHAKEQGISTIIPNGNFKKILRPAVIGCLSQLEEGNYLTSKHKELIVDKIPEFNRSSIRYKVFELIKAHGWDFITDKLFNDWNKLRNHIMHSGTYARLNQVKLAGLSRRLRISMQLALIDLLSCSDYVISLQGLKKQIERD